MKRLLILLLGIILASLGLFFILLYINLLVIGYSFLEFVYFIIRSIFCDLFFIGIFIIIFILRRD